MHITNINNMINMHKKQIADLEKSKMEFLQEFAADRNTMVPCDVKEFLECLFTETCVSSYVLSDHYLPFYIHAYLNFSPTKHGKEFFEDSFVSTILEMMTYDSHKEIDEALELLFPGAYHRGSELHILHKTYEVCTTLNVCEYLEECIKCAIRNAFDNM